jgi:hypothetical protein
MADISFPAFGSRWRSAGGDAAAFGEDEQQDDELLQEGEKQRTNKSGKARSIMLRYKLHGFGADLAGRVIQFFTLNHHCQRFDYQTNRRAAFNQSETCFKPGVFA